MKLERVGMPRWAVNRTKEATGKHGRSERSACRTLHIGVNTPRHKLFNTLHTAPWKENIHPHWIGQFGFFLLQDCIIFLRCNFCYPYALRAEISIIYFHICISYLQALTFNRHFTAVTCASNGGTIASRFAVKGSGFSNSGCIFGVWHFHFQVSYVREVNSFHFFSSVPCVWKHWNILKGGHRALC